MSLDQLSRFSKSIKKYYDLIDDWSKVEPFINHPSVLSAMHFNYNAYLLSHLGLPFDDAMTPETIYELNQRMLFGDDWKQEGFDARNGERQPYWTITAPHTCHWTANVLLEIAKSAEPEHPWRIISGKNHSTVWDGADTLFETHYLVIGRSADECYEAALESSTEGEIGQPKYAGITVPFFVPQGVDAEDYKNWDKIWVKERLVEDARRYFANLNQCFNDGNVDEPSALVTFELTRKFIEAAELNRRRKAAKVLAQLAAFDHDEAVSAVPQRV